MESVHWWSMFQEEHVLIDWLLLQEQIRKDKAQFHNVFAGMKIELLAVGVIILHDNDRVKLI